VGALDRRATNTWMHRPLGLGRQSISPEDLADLDLDIFDVTIGGVET
jgi:hypothetical protein